MFEHLEDAELGHEVALDELLDAVKFDSDGLVPAIAQDAVSKDVLMLAWMNREAVERTLEDGYACYWSRSRGAFWRKGETSGHLQALKEMRFDCDGDAILLLVDQTGPACHTNRPSCFYLSVADGTARVSSERA